MERCDFCSAMKIIREYISDERDLTNPKCYTAYLKAFSEATMVKN